jgi:glyoxylase-like metal-dependent hydrolase (beta-lactamase superfamily II)
MKHLAVAASLLMLGSVGLAQAPTPAPAPLVREGATVKLTDHVWVIPDFNVGLVPNVGIVVGDRATLVVDTGLGPRNGEAIVREMRKLSMHADVYVITTHYHPEHSLGMGAFTGAKLVIPKVQQQEMTELGQGIQATFMKRSPLHAELLQGVPYPTPDILFDREHRLDLGGVHVRLLWRGPAALHTRGDTMVWVEPDRVLFTGDVVFLQAVQTRAAEMKRAGRTVDEAIAAVVADIAPAYPEWGNPSGAAVIVRAAYAEAP